MTHSRPSFAGPLMPSTRVTRPSLTLTLIWQPTPQNGQTDCVSVSCASLSPCCASSMTLAGISAPVGQACTHSPQATQVLSPIGSSKSKTG